MPEGVKLTRLFQATTLSAASVYVGTYAKYNNGSLYGAWLNLSDYSDKEEFYEACRELHKDEEDAEYMFQDYENIPEALISESWISENFFALRDAVEDLSDTEQEAFFVWCNYKSHDLGEEDADDLVRDFRDEYQGDIGSNFLNRKWIRCTSTCRVRLNFYIQIYAFKLK